MLNQKGFTPIILLVGILIIAIIGGAGYYFYLQKTAYLPSKNPQKLTSSATPTALPTQTPQATSSAEVINVQFIPKQKILGTTSITRYSYTFYKVGKVLSGKYKDGDLVLVYIDFGPPCKGSGCGQDAIDRYIKLPDKVVYLPRISYNARPQLYPMPSPSGNPENPFSKLGLPLVVDNNVTIPALEYPEKINESNPSITLQLFKGNIEEDGQVDTSKLMSVFNDPTFGNIYTTKPGLGPQGSFYSSYGGGFSNKSLVGCRGADCFLTNSLIAFRPDGTYLMFYFTPPFLQLDSNNSAASNIINVNWNSGINITSSYRYQTYIQCEGLIADAMSVIDPNKVRDSDLVVLGTVKNSNDPIYGLKDPNNPILKDFYKTYSDEIKNEQQYDSSQTTKTYDQFTASYPILIWKDPFGRYIRLNNQDFVPPGACEPIIYLYPQKREKVSINFGQSVNLIASTPTYNNGWNVIASPNGSIFNTFDSKTYSYLFWEGFSTFYPKQDNGFVIKSDNVENFFQNTLPKLGLNTQEANDFIKTWLPSFKTAPYYFITFYDTTTVNSLVPLNIAPKPDTLIRIMMDFRPLTQPVYVQPLAIPQFPVRNGFTVVEWGALKR